jgi:transposase
MSKSTKHRALAASREKALKTGRLDQWYAERAADKLAAERRGEKLRAETYVADPFANYEAISTPEGASWDDRGYMRWTLPVSSGSNRPSAPRN